LTWGKFSILQQFPYPDNISTIFFAGLKICFYIVVQSIHFLLTKINSMKTFKGFAGVAVLLAVSAIFYSPSFGNKDGPASQAQLHSTKFIPQFHKTPGHDLIQLATAAPVVSFKRPATASTRVILAPLPKDQHYVSIVARDNGPPAV
jgi:hypothetical protein